MDPIAAAMAVPCMLTQVVHKFHSLIEHEPHAQGLFQIYVATPLFFDMASG